MELVSEFIKEVKKISDPEAKITFLEKAYASIASRKSDAVSYLVGYFQSINRVDLSDLLIKKYSYKG